MPEFVATRKAFCYLLLFSLTAHARTGYLYLLSKPWYPNPSTSSTTITEELLPFLMHLGPQPIPANDNLVKIIVFLLHFHSTIGCLGMYVFGTVMLLEMALLSLLEMWKRGGWRRTVWARDPLDLMYPAKRNSFEKIILLIVWCLFFVWIQLAVLLLFLTAEWELHHLWKDKPQWLFGPDVSENASRKKILYTFFGVGTVITVVVTVLNIRFLTFAP